MRKDKKKIFLFVRSPAASHASLMAKNFFLAFKNVKKKEAGQKVSKIEESTS